MVDTRGLSPQLEGKKLRVYFIDGEVCEVKLLSLELHENCHLCDGYTGFIYDLLSTNRPEEYTTEASSSAYWGNFEDIERVEVA